MERRDTRTADLSHFARRVTVGLVLVAVAALICYAAKLLLLIFAGALLAVLLDFLAGKLGDAVRLSRGWTFVIVVMGIALLLAFAGWIAVPRIAEQFTELIRSLPESLGHLQTYLGNRPWGHTLCGVSA